MSDPVELADVFRRYGDAFRQSRAGHLGRGERRVMGAVAACRTATLGGHVEQCDDCGATRIAYNSCRNRHCPKCQSTTRERWLKARQAELLPAPYFHVVFTLPPSIAAVAFQNKAAVYAILFRAAAEALRKLAADPRHLGAELGILAVLHTWGQTLQHHPHVHCVVPGGGPSPDNKRWKACKPGFFLPVGTLSRLFRGIFIDHLRMAFEADELRFFGDFAHLADPCAFAKHLAEARRANWVVYSKRPFAGPERVLAYLARYTHRVAIANSRLTSADNEKVSFTWRDYRHAGQTKLMTLDAEEFIRRFLLHVLPDGFHRIRYYGFLAAGRRAENLLLCRRLLAADQAVREPEPAGETSGDDDDRPAPAPAPDPCVCTDCGGRMRRVGPTPSHPARAHSFRCDTS
jgi:hypothetical protein